MLVATPSTWLGTRFQLHTRLWYHEITAFIEGDGDTVFYPLVSQRIYSLKSSLLDAVEQLL